MTPKRFLIAICLALPAFAAKQRVELVTADKADVAANTLVHIVGSTGELNIAGWDQPSVEVVATRYAFVEERNKRKVSDKLKRIEVVKMDSGKDELTITTTRRHESGVHVDYQIMVPRASRLLIRHHIGDVLVTDVGGDIDAKSGAGDIVLQLPEKGNYTIDAKVGFGAVYSDFDTARHRNLAGERLSQSATAAADAKTPPHKIDLRVDAGGISIQKREVARNRASPEGTETKPDPGF